MIFEHEIFSMPFSQLFNCMKILEGIVERKESEHPHVILIFDEPFGSAIRIDYNIKTKKVQISCTEAYYKQNISTKE